MGAQTFARPPKLSHLDTIRWEIDMLDHCFRRLVEGPTDKYVYLECFLLHYRNLLEFFSANHTRSDDDLSIQDWKVWADRTPASPEIATLNTLKKEADPLDKRYWKDLSMYIQHCTTRRHEEDKDWPVQEMYEKLEHILLKFEKLFPRPSAPATMRDPLWGMMADDPQLMDEVVESAMKAREEHPLRSSGG